MKSIKVRFNLGRGENYLKWKVTHPDGDVIYYSPAEVQLVMTECTFKNHKSTAQKIYDGGNKTVCAWVLCKEIEIKTTGFIKDETKKVQYNPRVQPNWLYEGKVMDNETSIQLHTIDYGVYIS
jgi:hypothetical protein